MEYIYGALLLHSAGQKIEEANMTKVMEASGAKVENAKVKALVASLEGVNIDDAISKAAAAPVAVAAAPAAAAAAHAAAPAAKEEHKEEHKKEDEESGMAGLGALFG